MSRIAPPRAAAHVLLDGLPARALVLLQLSRIWFSTTAAQLDGRDGNAEHAVVAGVGDVCVAH